MRTHTHARTRKHANALTHTHAETHAHSHLKGMKALQAFGIDSSPTIER